MPLPGIRLNDLYNSDDYKSWVNDPTNIKLIETETSEYGFDLNQTQRDRVKQHLYLNSRIRQDLGDDVYNSMPDTLGVQEKIDYYNNHLPKDNNNSPRDTVSNWGKIVDEETARPSGYYNPIESVSDENIVPDGQGGWGLWNWFKDKANTATDRDYQLYLNAERRKNPELPSDKPVINPFADNSSLTREYKDVQDYINEHPEDTAGIQLRQNMLNANLEKAQEEEEDAQDRAATNLNYFRLIYDNFDNPEYLPVERDHWKSQKTADKITNLATEIRSKLDNDDSFAFSAYDQFSRMGIDLIPQWRNYHDTEALPITPNEIKDLMAQYYSIRTIMDLNEANNFVQSALQDKLADNQSILEKSEIALTQAGAYFAGNIASAVGIAAMTPWALRMALDNDYDIEDLGFFKELQAYAENNPLTYWGANVISTGAWLPDVQERFKELDYNRLQLQRASGNETKFIDINTPFELFSQAAFTVSGMYIGGAAAQILGNTVGRGAAQLATRILSSGAAGAGTRFAARAVNVLGQSIAVGGTAYLPAAAEASMDSLEKYQTAKDNAQNNVLEGLEKELQQDLEDGTFEDWYNRNTRFPLTMPPAEGWTPEESERQAQLRSQERAYLWDEYRNLKAQEVLNNPDVKREIENAAFREGARIMFDESTYIAFGDMFFTNVLGRGFKELKKGVYRGITGRSSTGYNWIPEGNFYRATPKQITFWDRAGAVGKGFVEAGEEGFEELFQTVDSQMREDLNNNYIAQYVANRYDPDAIGQLTDGLRENWDVAKLSIHENVLSDEALYSFLLGAVSAGIGSPTIVRGIKTAKAKHAKGEKATFWDFFRNPIVENLQDLKVKQIESEAEAADINRWLKEQEGLGNLYNDETAILKFIADKKKAAEKDDEVAYRDALMGQKVATLLMMDRVRPNGMKINLHARMKALANLDANSAEARTVVDQILKDDESGIVRTADGPLNEEEMEVLNKAKKRAQDDINTYRNLKAQIAILNSQFGNTISSESRDALAYALIMRNNWNDRVAEITKNAIDSYNQANPDNQVAPISEEEKEVKNAIARYGSLKAVEEEYKALMKQRAQLRATKKFKYKHEYKTEFDKNTKDIQNNRAAKKLLEQKDLPIITANEILSLDNKARAYLLDKANRKHYNVKQQAEISKFQKAEGISGQTLTDLRDAGRLQNKIDYFKDEYDKLLENNGVLIPLFDREIRARAAEKWSRAKLENVLGATTYNQFRAELDKALATGEFTANDRAQFSRIFNNPENPNKDSAKFYQQYQKEEMYRDQVRKLMENSPAFKNLNDNQKKAATQVIKEQQLSGEALTAKNIINRLSDPKFLESLSREELEELGNALEEVIKQKENYDKNVAAEAERQKKLQEAKMVEDARRGVPGSTKVDETVISNEKYQNALDYFNNIFKKIVSIFTNTNPQVLSKKEFIDFISLYSDIELSDDILGEDFDTSLTISNLITITNNLLTTLENNAYLNSEAAKDIKYQNTINLIGVLKGLVQTVRNSGGDLNAFIRNTILEVNTSLKADFKVKAPKLSERLSNFYSKAASRLQTEAEKKWYEDNNIIGNLQKVAALKARKQSYVFIKDENLINSVRQELGVEEFNDDNLPIIMAARVTKDVESAIQLEDGNYYLYVGLLQDSRPAAIYDKNDLNALREAAISQEEFGPIKQNGKVYVSKGGNVNYPKPQSTTTQTESLKDYLLDKYNGNKEAAKKDFIDHFRSMRATINHNTGQATGSVDWKGRTIDISFTTKIKDKDNHTYAIYLLEKPDGSVEPKILFVKELDEFSFDNEKLPDISSVYDALSGPLLTDEAYKDTGLDFLINPIKHISGKIIPTYVEKLKSYRESSREEALKHLNEALSKYLSKKFNFKKPAKLAPEFKVELSINNGNLEFHVYQEVEGGSKGIKKVQYRDIPEVVSKIPIEDLKNKDALARFVQDALKNLMYNEEGELRRDGENNSGYPLVKIEAFYQEAEDKKNSRQFDSQYAASILLADAFKLMNIDTSAIPESISVNPTIQGGSSRLPRQPGETAVDHAIRQITQEQFIDTSEGGRGGHANEDSDEIDTTTFIREGADGPDTTNPAVRVSLALGTSVDKLYRVWRESHDFKSVEDFMRRNDLASWVGISRLDIEQVCNQFKRIDRYFASKGERQINIDLRFINTITINGRSHRFVGKPDIITVDKNGIYHIYDMKSFRYVQGKIAEFNNGGLILNGLGEAENHYNSWQKQMSIYKALIESFFGEGSVSPEFGVVPVRLGYPAGGDTKNDTKAESVIGTGKVTAADGSPLHVDISSKLPLDGNEPVTRCYDEVIKIPAITDISKINPEGWATLSKADRIGQSFREAKIKASNAEIQNVEVEVAKEPTNKGSIDEASEEDVARGLQGPSIDLSIEELLAGACGNQN